MEEVIQAGIKREKRPRRLSRDRLRRVIASRRGSMKKVGEIAGQLRGQMNGQAYSRVRHSSIHKWLRGSFQSEYIEAACRDVAREILEQRERANAKA